MLNYNDRVRDIYCLSVLKSVLTIESNPIIPWTTITDCHIAIHGTGKYSKHYFTVYTIDNYFEIEVNEMAGSKNKLDDAANEYLSWSRQQR